MPKRRLIPALAVVLVIPGVAIKCAGQTSIALSSSCPLPASSNNVKASDISDLRGHVPFQALDNPRLVAGGTASFMHDNEPVVGVSMDGENRAYALRFLKWHHIVNDRLKSGTPILVTYCSACDDAAAFDPRVGGKSLVFQFFGYSNPTFAMLDDRTKSLWLQQGGLAIDGSMRSRSLRRIPITRKSWSDWKKDHPDTVVLAPAGGRYDDPSSVASGSRLTLPRSALIALLFLPMGLLGWLRLRARPR